MALLPTVALLALVPVATLPLAAQASCGPAPRRQLEALEAHCTDEHAPPLRRACDLALDRLRRCLPPGRLLDSGETQYARFAVEDPADRALRYLLEFEPSARRDGDPVTVHTLQAVPDTSRSIPAAQRHRMRRLLGRYCRRDKDPWSRPVCRAFDRTLARWPRWTAVTVRPEAIEVRIPDPAPGRSVGAADRRCAVTFLPASRPTYVGDLYCCLECM